jgi:diguanylate cyclase (GGDEF)-like protein/PAS domain S-box-containing protein
LDWNKRATRDAAVIFVVAAVAYALSEHFNLFNEIARFQNEHGDWGLDDIVIVSLVVSIALAAYGWRRMQDLRRENVARRAAEEEVGKQVKQLNRTKSFLNTIVEGVPAAIIVKELPNRRYTLVNRAAERLLGVPRDQILGKTAAEMYPAETAAVVDANDLATAASADPTTHNEYLLATPCNGTRTVVRSGLVIPDDSGDPRYLLNVVQDITEHRRAEAKIEHLARHDALTDLPNRTAFNERLEGEIVTAAALGTSLAVLWIDLDRFKQVNDVFGYAVGDALLHAIAKRMQEASGGQFLARVSGDEFALICRDGMQPVSAEALADRLLRAIDGPIEVQGHSVRAGMSIGVAIYPTDATDSAGLRADADAALTRAKADGRGAVRFFEAGTDQRLREKRTLQHDLSSAAERHELMLYYQPQATIDGNVFGFEALMRWNHPTRGMVPAGEFIPVAEESGLIVTLGEWILREACQEAASWSRPLRIAVNLSPIQFRHGDLPNVIHSALLATGLSADRLEVEITEGVLIEDFARALSALRRIKALGVRIAMDDFGSGYSSLSYLHSFPFDKIKIDQKFVAGLERNPQSAAIIRAVIGLGRGLNLPVIAEGVETKTQLAFLKRESCDEVQGYLIGRPAPIDTYAPLVGRDARLEASLAG